MEQELNVVRSSYIQLTKVLETNTRVFSDAFQMVDAHIHVMQRAFTDFAQGKAYLTPVGGIDFAEYLMEYWACISFAEFVAVLKEGALEKTTILTPTQMAADDEGAVIFGGV